MPKSVLPMSVACALLLFAAIAGSAEPGRVGGDGASSPSTASTASTPSLAPAPQGWPASYFSGPAGQGNVLPARKGVLVGIHDSSNDQLLQRQSQAGRSFDLGSAGYQGYTINFDGRVSWLLARGVTPVISYLPPRMTPAQLASGSADASYRASARAVAALKPSRVMIRPFWEFNGDWTWYHPESADQFKAYWKRMVDIFKAEGATNVSWVWAPDEGPRDTAYPAYPGDAYVDWVGSSAYNWYPGWCGPRYGWCEFSEGFGQSRSVHDTYPQKPFMAAEFGTIEHPDIAGKKAEWIRRIQTDIPTRFNHMLAMMYFDWNYDRDWRLTTSPSVLDAWTRLVNDPYFNTSDR